VAGTNKVTATAGGDADYVGTGPITERGICWATSARPTTADSKATAGSGAGQFSANLMDLVYATTYHARAYVISDGKTYYGNDIEFQAVLAPVELIKNGDFKLPDDGVKYTNLNSIPNWKTDDASQDLTGREFDPYRNTGCAYLNDWANFYQVLEDVPGVKSNYKVKFDANYIWTDWAPYAPKFYVIFSSFTGDPSTRTAIQSLEIASLSEYPADASSNWKAYEANFSIPAGSPHAGKKLVVEWVLENYKTEPWGWSNTWYNFDNISVLRSLE
jgi:hypothetical protein